MSPHLFGTPHRGQIEETVSVKNLRQLHTMVRAPVVACSRKGRKANLGSQELARLSGGGGWLWTLAEFPPTGGTRSGMTL